jgi:hypothetical protein
MFNILSSLTKAAVAVVATPVALAVDVLTLPASSMDPHRGPFDRTEEMLDAVGKNISAAVKEDQND